VLHVLPLLWHLLGATNSSGAVQGGSSSIRTATHALVHSLYSEMGSLLMVIFCKFHQVLNWFIFTQHKQYKHGTQPIITVTMVMAKQTITDQIHLSNNSWSKSKCLGVTLGSAWALSINNDPISEYKWKWTNQMNKIFSEGKGRKTVWFQIIKYKWWFFITI
jgi:hypothetical protein